MKASLAVSNKIKEDIAIEHDHPVGNLKILKARAATFEDYGLQWKVNANQKDKYISHFHFPFDPITNKILEEVTSAIKGFPTNCGATVYLKILGEVEISLMGEDSRIMSNMIWERSMRRHLTIL